MNKEISPAPAEQCYRSIGGGMQAFMIEGVREEDYLDDLVHVTCLLVEDGYHEYSFVHKSVQEYYAAEFIRDANATLKEQFYRKARSDLGVYIKFMAVLDFLKIVDDFDYYEQFVIPTMKETSFLEPSNTPLSPIRLNVATLRERLKGITQTSSIDKTKSLSNWLEFEITQRLLAYIISPAVETLTGLPSKDEVKKLVGEALTEARKNPSKTVDAFIKNERTQAFIDELAKAHPLVNARRTSAASILSFDA